MVLATQEAEVGGSPILREVKAAVSCDCTTALSLGNRVRLCLRKKKNKIYGQAQWLTLVIPALWEANGQITRSGVHDQPDQHGDTPSLLKTQKISWASRHGGRHP